MTKNSLKNSKHFDLHPLAEDVFAAVARDGGSAISNSGLVDLGGQLLVFDTFLASQAAKDLRRFSLDQFGREPQVVVNSHYHNDHIWGNQVFAPEAQILASARTRELITTAGMEEYEWYSTNSSERYESLRAQLQTADEAKKKQLIGWIAYYGGLVEALPDLQVCLPGITFDHHLEIHGSRLTAELITFEGAHTGSDTVLYLPQARTVFMSDLLFVDSHPYLGDGDPFQLLSALRELSQLEAVHFVPGHGPVGTVDELKIMTRYVEDCLGTAQRLVEKGVPEEDRTRDLALEERYGDWQLSQFYPMNINFLCERILQARDK